MVQQTAKIPSSALFRLLIATNPLPSRKNSKATTRYFSQRVMPAALFRAGKKRSFGLYISSLPDGTLMNRQDQCFALSKS